MGDANQTFNVELEDGRIVPAQLLSVVEVDGKDYAIYSVDNENDTVDILASYVEKDEEGYDMLVTIDREEDREKIKAVIEQLRQAGQL